MSELLSVIKDFTPISTVALALVIIFQLVRQKKSVTSIKDNHLEHVQASLDKMNDTLLRIESDSKMHAQTSDRNFGELKESMSYLKARLNGGPK